MINPFQLLRSRQRASGPSLSGLFAARVECLSWHHRPWWLRSMVYLSKLVIFPLSQITRGYQQCAIARCWQMRLILKVLHHGWQRYMCGAGKQGQWVPVIFAWAHMYGISHIRLSRSKTCTKWRILLQDVYQGLGCATLADSASIVVGSHRDRQWQSFRFQLHSMWAMPNFVVDGHTLLYSCTS